MPTYNVHLYRVMRLYFPGIEADTPQKAAKIVAEYPSEKAESYEDCDGETLGALVDLVGDEDFSESVMVDLDPMKAAAQELYEALLLLTETYGTFESFTEKGKKVEFELPSDDPLFKARVVLAKARGETLPEAA